MSTQPRISIIIVTWNSEDDIQDCLHSIEKQDYKNFEVLIVDNASSDQTVAIVKEKFPWVYMLAESENHFFAGGNNLGMHYAYSHFSPDFMVILNPDTQVATNWLSQQINIMQKKQAVGIIGPKVVFAEGYGTETQKTSKTQIVINTVGLVRGGFLFPYDRGFGEVDTGQYEEEEKVFGISGVSMFIRTKLLEEVGLFYEPMQMYLEDADLSTRAVKAGWENIYTPSTLVYHKHMQSTGQRKSDFYLKKSLRNYLLLVGRNYSLKKLLRAILEVSKQTNIKQLIAILWNFGIIAIFKSRNYKLI